MVEEEPEVEEPVVKKAFKLDLSKIDFADDIDDTVETAPEAVEPEVEEIEEPTEDVEEKPQSISFKNFFKKK